MTFNNEQRRRKVSEPRERRYVAEYVYTYYPNAIKMFNVRLGDVPEQFKYSALAIENVNMYKVFRRFVDALVITEDEAILIEAKMIAKAENLAQLELYARLLTETKELQQLIMNKKIRKKLVAVVVDRVLVREAERYNVEVEVYRPSWAVEYAERLLKGRIS
ncbi:MAG: hypothetical protein QXW26_04690 [Candidatus Nitrosocaldus sp.]